MKIKFIWAIILIYLLYRIYAYSIIEGYSRANIFSRYHYEPNFNVMSPANHTKRRVIIQGRPYIPNEEKSSWYLPWYYPEKSNVFCLKQAEFRCGEKLNLNKDVIHTSKCWNSVYQQCVDGVEPLKIRLSIDT